jgi:hypothetical protein
MRPEMTDDDSDGGAVLVGLGLSNTVVLFGLEIRVNI